LKLLGSGPMLPYILNPLNVVLPLPRRLSVDNVRWVRVVLVSFVLSTLHEAQRVSISTTLSWWRQSNDEPPEVDLEDVFIKGEARKPSEATRDEDDDGECLICAGAGVDTALSESVTSLSSVSVTPSLGPLEAFCVNAPHKHPMHRTCFLSWKDAYWEERTRHARPFITFVDENKAVLLPMSSGWLRALAILSASGLAPMVDFIPSLPGGTAGVDLFGENGSPEGSESVFVLCAQSKKSASRNVRLATLQTPWPPCPGCRSAVKMCFECASAAPAPPDDNESRSRAARVLCAWGRAWRELVTGRTVLVKAATQVLFVIFLVSVMRAKAARAKGGSGLFARFS